MRSFACLTLAVLVMIGCSSNEPVDEPKTQIHQQPEVDEVKTPAPLIIDVRTPQEFGSGHIEDAINIPHERIGSRIAEFATDKDQKIVLYCRSGRRSGLALKTLNDMEYTDVENAGGFEELRKKLEE